MGGDRGPPRGARYPYDELRRIWETVLLLQFHDILPGTSIAWVHQEAEAEYERVAGELETLITTALDALRADTGDPAPAAGDPAPAAGDSAPVAANAGPYPRHGVPAMGVGPVTAPAAARPLRRDDRIVLDDGALHVEIDDRGTLVSVRDLRADRELLPPGVAGGVLQLFRDTPREWDAWDINDEDKRSGTDLLVPVAVDIVDDAVVVRHERGRTVLTQCVRLCGGRIDYTFDIDWHESQKLLKLAFPLDIRTDRSTSEIQFGHLHRPIHRNTSWDAARFETVAHRWIHVGEPGYGVAIANDVVYGHDIRGGRTPDGRSMTTARLSLLRAPAIRTRTRTRDGTPSPSASAPAGYPTPSRTGTPCNCPRARCRGPRRSRCWRSPTAPSSWRASSSPRTAPVISSCACTRRTATVPAPPCGPRSPGARPSPPTCWSVPWTVRRSARRRPAARSRSSSAPSNCSPCASAPRWSEGLRI